MGLSEILEKSRDRRSFTIEAAKHLEELTGRFGGEAEAIRKLVIEKEKQRERADDIPNAVSGKSARMREVESTLTMQTEGKNAQEREAHLEVLKGHSKEWSAAKDAATKASFGLASKDAEIDFAQRKLQAIRYDIEAGIAILTYLTATAPPPVPRAVPAEVRK